MTYPCKVNSLKLIVARPFYWNKYHLSMKKNTVLLRTIGLRPILQIFDADE